MGRERRWVRHPDILPYAYEIPGLCHNQDIPLVTAYITNPYNNSTGAFTQPHANMNKIRLILAFSFLIIITVATNKFIL